MKVELIKIKDLKPNNGQIKDVPKNPRFMKDYNYRKLIKSLEEDPEMLELREIIAYDLNGDNSSLIVVAGNMRLRASIEVGIKEIPTKILPKETTANKLRRYIIKDNTAFGDWQIDDIANEWDDDPTGEWGLDMPNYHSINNEDPDNLIGFDEVLNIDDYYHLNITFETEELLNQYMSENKIILKNNYKKVNKTISIKWPQEERRDIKNVEFK